MIHSTSKLFSFSILCQVNATVKLLKGHPGDVIVKEAETSKADLILVGSRGHGTVRRTMMGSVSDFIVHHSHVPVLICKHESHLMERSVST